MDQDLGCREDGCLDGRGATGAVIKHRSIEEVANLLDLMVQKESRLRPRNDYIECIQQDGMNRSWRWKIWQWIVEVATELNFAQETANVALTYLDLYVSKRSVDDVIFSIAAVAALLVAGKTREIELPNMTQLEYLCDNAFSASSICQMELELMKVLEWDLNPVTAQEVAYAMLGALPSSEARQLLASYTEIIMGFSLGDYALLDYSPTVVGLSAVLSAAKLTGQNVAEVLKCAQLSSIDGEHIPKCVSLLLECVAEHCPEIMPSRLRQRMDSPESVIELDSEDEMDGLGGFNSEDQAQKSLLQSAMTPLAQWSSFVP